jgi:hypothetical protein
LAHSTYQRRVEGYGRMQREDSYVVDPTGPANFSRGLRSLFWV